MWFQRCFHHQISRRNDLGIEMFRYHVMKIDVPGNRPIRGCHWIFLRPVRQAAAAYLWQVSPRLQGHYCTRLHTSTHLPFPQQNGRHRLRQLRRPRRPQGGRAQERRPQGRPPRCAERPRVCLSFFHRLSHPKILCTAAPASQHRVIFSREACPSDRASPAFSSRSQLTFLLVSLLVQ